MIRFKTTRLDKVRASANYAREQVADIRQETRKTHANLGMANRRARAQAFLTDCILIAVQIPCDLETYNRYGKRNERAQEIRQRRIGLWLTQQTEASDVPIQYLHLVTQEHLAAEDIMERVGSLCAPGKKGVVCAFGVNTITKRLGNGGLAALEHDQTFNRVSLIQKDAEDDLEGTQTVLFATDDVDVPFPFTFYPEDLSAQDGQQLLIAAHTGWSVRTMITRNDGLRLFQVGSAVSMLSRIEDIFGLEAEASFIPSAVTTK